MKVIYFILFLFITTSCLQPVARPDGFFDNVKQETSCEELFYLFNEVNSCASECSSGETVATTEQVTDMLSDPDISDDVKEIIQTSKGVCITEEEVIERPTGSIFIQDDFCICKNNSVASITGGNNCTSVCNGKDVTVATIFGNVTVGPEIEGNQNLKNLFGFCNTTIENGAENPPSCDLIATDISGKKFNVDLATIEGTNFFEANLEANAGIEFNKTYTFHIEENGSKIENAISDSEQFSLFEPDDGNDFVGNLKIKLISQYTCIIRVAGTSSNYDPNDQVYLDSIRKHFYMPVDYPTPYLPPGVSDTVFCHDYISTGQSDDAPQFTRLELIPDHFSLWDVNDVRFIKDGDNRTIDFLIKDRMVQMGANISGTKSYFAPLEACVSPNVSVDSGFPAECNSPETGRIEAGLAMIPFFTDNTGKAICPGTDEYNGQNLEFRAIGEMIGVPTEGLYFAQGPREVIELDDGTKQEIKPADILYIREGQLKKIWFHLTSNGVHYKPTESTESQPTYFYWPADEDAPLIKKEGYQKLYQVMHSSELLSGGFTTTIPTTIKPIDRKMGCVPQTSAQ